MVGRYKDVFLHVFLYNLHLTWEMYVVNNMADDQTQSASI